MSFPPCTFRPPAWASRTRTAPGGWSLSTTDGTESCLSQSQSWIWFDPLADFSTAHSEREREEEKKRKKKHPADKQMHLINSTDTPTDRQMSVKRTDEDTDERFFAGL